MTEVKRETECFVIYCPQKGFLCGRKSPRFVENFDKARVFGRRIDAELSKKSWESEFNAKLFVIPVLLTLDPRKLFKTVLAG